MSWVCIKHPSCIQGFTGILFHFGLLYSPLVQEIKSSIAFLPEAFNILLYIHFMLFSHFIFEPEQLTLMFFCIFFFK